jgi:hypothetical protein
MYKEKKICSFFGTFYKLNRNSYTKMIDIC